ncbi:Gp37-like protein [Prescottella equi]|uniref:Gp37-like protein n=1 Tax=Rhodococcus hoagii TaxID=43767 RepID=UPI000D111327|nr:phage tail protein [Prescottella equi]AVP71350.1 phage tail protein [Prescottella equi]MBM4469941.1 phage tail protein [Prescottella equi]NKZ84546.1 phage tail protein [Prescottella equi]
MTAIPDVAPTSVADLERIYQDAIRKRRERREKRLERPLVRLWDGDWNLRGRCGAELSGDFKRVMNESSTGTLELPADYYLAKWVMNPQKRSTENVHVTVDKDGSRWDGRMRSATIKKSATGQLTVVVTFMHSYEELKYFQAWCNPFLPAALQVPRVFTLAGPAAWILKLSLHLQILRRETLLGWHLPDDPLNLASWAGLSQANWSVVVKPGSFWEDGSQWGLISSRFKNWHDMAADTLDDAQLMVETRRYLRGDPPPWKGANLRHGALVVDVVDKSGYYTGTSTGGNIATGLVRSVGRFFGDFYESTQDIIDPTADPKYFEKGWLGTTPTQPWVVFREGVCTGIRTSEFTINPATAVQINTGGHSAPGVNQAIKASVIMAGNLIGTIFTQSGLGSVADAVLEPLYTDTVAAWMSYMSDSRKARLGWSHYFEYFQSGGDRAYTLSSLVALRAGLWATRSYFTHKLEVSDGAPYLVGENGQGHFFLGDRVGSTVAGMDDGAIYVDQVTQLDLSWKRGVPATWSITIGSTRDMEDGAVRALSYVQKLMSTAHDMGVL